MRYVTWNMQGGNDGKFGDVASLMQKNGIQVACLQETGTLPSQYVQQTKTVNGIQVSVGTFNGGGSSRGANYSVINFNNNLGQNNRCSLAIFCEDAVLDYAVVAAPSDRLRPMIGIRISGDRWIYSIHAPSSKSAAGVASSMLRQIPAAQTKWACFGDYNCEPAQIQCPGGAATVGGTASTHQNGGKLDYVVAKGITLAPAKVTKLVSDHYSQAFSD